MVDKSNKKVKGALAEAKACGFLENQGLCLIQKNFLCPTGEIDLIMQDQDTVVFVEIRLRSSTTYGNAIESVNLAKQRKLIKTALLYLQKKRWLHRVNCRFDVIGIDINGKIEWLKNAFSADNSN